MPPRPMCAIHRFLRKILRTASGCWLWQANITSAGYGLFWFDETSWLAHRWSWLTFRGKIPGGLVIRHMCGNKLCVNPGHLDIGTQQQNVMDAIAAGTHAASAKTHCKRGHPFDEKNTYRFVSKGKPRRGCRICRNEASKLRHRQAATMPLAVRQSY